MLDNAPMKGTLTFLGIIAPERDPIEYHERAPLVVPKTMELPQPAAQQATARNQAWPTDPDVARKLREKAAEAQPAKTQPDNPILSISSMLGIRSNSPPIEPPGPQAQRPYASGYIPNGVLRAQGEQFASQNPNNSPEDQIRPGFEPKRRYLTDPPTGYRRPSDKASFKKQYSAPVKRADDSHPLDFVKEQADRQKGNFDPDKEQ
ncbi:MAG: hypothetical protein ACHQAY_03720 [Hyphomicrobiales bacterium]